jgi:glycosyltransferase involved in cell wall biosynthesis
MLHPDPVIVYDLQAIQSPVHAGRGIGRFVWELALALQREHAGLVDAFAWNDALDRPGELDRFDGPTAAFEQLRGADVDVLHVGSPFEPLPIDRLLPPCTARSLIATVYDLIPYRFADVYLRDPGPAAAYRSRLGLLVTADAIVADSHAAAHELEELVGVPRHRVTVVGAGVGERFVPPGEPAAVRLATLQRALPTLRAGYVLVPAGMDWRKNAAGAIAAHAALPTELRQRHQLVLQCAVTDGYAAWLEHLAREAGNLDQLVLTGQVDDDLLVALLQTSEVVCVPSYAEGFGLPVLEALHCGARVICSDTSSLPELVRDRNARFDPWDTASITRTLSRALTDGAGATFDPPPGGAHSWSATAAAVAAVYRRP